MRLLALTLLTASRVASASTVELDCTDPSRADKPHWSVVLNEETGTGTVVVMGSNYTMANKPAAFMADEVRITTREERFGAGHVGASIFSINRTTLHWKWIERIDERELPGATEGLCKIVNNPDRKI
jgi:hypothetical protein